MSDELNFGGKIDSFGRVWLSPYGKRQKYMAEMKCGHILKNDGTSFKDEKGNVVPLTKEQRSWRSGYCECQKEEARNFRRNNPNYQNKVSTYKPKDNKNSKKR